MFVRTNPGGKVVNIQPASATLLTPKKGRNAFIITNLTASTKFYIKLGDGASDGVAGVGGNWSFISEGGKPAIVIDNWTGKVTCDPAPAAGELNIAEIYGSTYTAA